MKFDNNSLWVVAVAVGLTLSPLAVGYEPTSLDADALHRPLKAELSQALAGGHLPFWSDRIGLGYPLVAESHVQAFYPPNHVLYRLFEVPAAYRWTMWLSCLALAVTTYGYGRALELTPCGSALAALAFTLCGFQTAHSCHEVFYQALPYLPLSLLIAEYYLVSGQPVWLGLLALCYGVQLTVGHYHLQFFTGILVVLTAAWRVVLDGRPWHRGLGLVGALAWGAAVAAVQLVPSWELFHLVGAFRRNWIQMAGGAFPIGNWAQLALPRFYMGPAGEPVNHYWGAEATSAVAAGGLYIGTIPLILACVGVVSRSRRRLALWLILIPLSYVLACLPKLSPAGFRLLIAIPGLGYFRGPARYTVLTELGLALLSGLGLDRAIRERRFRIGLMLAVAFGALATLRSIHLTYKNPFFWDEMGGERLWYYLMAAALSWAVGLAMVVSWHRGRIGTTGAADRDSY